MSITTIAIIGLGSRGKDAYAEALSHMPGRAKVVALADPDADKLKQAKTFPGLEDAVCYASGEELLAQPKLADAVIICTQDRQHVPHAIAAMEKGYDVLLEKPISPDLQECKDILSVSRKTGRKVVVCHVLRYSPFFRKIYEILRGGTLGRLMTIQGIENVCYWHQAHSFVRGNWRSSAETSPMFLAKCCHDMDLMVWLTGKKCLRVSSFGSLGQFKPENAPEGAALRCLDGCKARENCPYDAEKIYLTNKSTGVLHGKTGWPCNILSLNPTEETIRKAITEGPYGRCVYFCDNDVVDHQVVNLEMEDGLTINFTMSAFTAGGGRYTNFMGTHGNMIADLDKKLITVTPFGGEAQVFDFAIRKDEMVGHAGGDSVLIDEFLDYLAGAHPDSITTLEDSMESHFIAMAAEESRVGCGAVVEMEGYRE